MKFSFPHVAFVGAFEWGSASGFAQDFPLKSICIIVGALPGRVGDPQQTGEMKPCACRTR